MTTSNQIGANKSKNFSSYPPSKLKGEIERAVTKLIVSNLGENNAKSNGSTSNWRGSNGDNRVIGGGAEISNVNYGLIDPESFKVKEAVNTRPTTPTNTSNGNASCADNVTAGQCAGNTISNSKPTQSFCTSNTNNAGAAENGKAKQDVKNVKSWLIIFG